MSASNLSSSFLATIGASLLSWSLLLVASRILLIRYALDPWIFTFLQMIAGGAFLVLTGRPAGGALEALKSPHTWLYGVLRVGTAAFFTAALAHTTTPTAAFIGIVSVPISALALWIFVSRRPSPWELPGHLLIVTGLMLVGGDLDGGYANPAILLMFSSELCVVTSTLIAEFHPMNRTESTSERAFLSGIMLLSSALLMLLLAAGMSFAGHFLPATRIVLPSTLPWLSAPAVLLDPKLWIAGILVGILLRGPSLFFSLSAINTAKTEGYIAGMAALPFLSLGLEWLAVTFGWLDPPQSATRAALFGAFMTFGSLAVLWARTRAATARMLLKA